MNEFTQGQAEASIVKAKCCGNCKHWDKIDKYGRHGDCDIHQMIISPLKECIAFFPQPDVQNGEVKK